MNSIISFAQESAKFLSRRVSLESFSIASSFVRNKYKLKTKKAAVKRLRITTNGIVTHPTHLSGGTKIYGARDPRVSVVRDALLGTGAYKYPSWIPLATKLQKTEDMLEEKKEK